MKLHIAIALMLVLSASACERTASDAQKAVDATAEAAQEQVASAEETMAAVVEQVEVKTAAKVDEVVEGAKTQVEAAKTQVAQVVASVDVAKPAAGESVYKKSCAVCHASGAANAPKPGDKAAWAPRLAKGESALLKSAINGVPGTAMMKRGGCSGCSDDDLKAAISYMIAK